MKTAVLGVDVGTASTKAVLFDLSGAELARAARPYRFQIPHSGWVEQAPLDLWDAVVGAIRAVVDAAGPGMHTASLALAAQSGSLILAQADGTPVHPAMIWMDGRSAGLVAEWKAAGVETEVRRISGWHLYPGLCLASIAWLRRFRPGIFTAAERFFSVNDYLIYRLSGEMVTNPSNAAVSQLVDVASGQWSPALCDLAGITPERLSPIRPSGTVVGEITPETQSLTGLPAGTLVVNGGHDQNCAALGLGIGEPNRLMLACGTSWVLTGVTTTPSLESIPPGFSLNFHLIPERWTASQSLGGLGATLEWWLGQGWQGPDSREPVPRTEMYASLDRELSDCIPRPDDPIFLPFTGTEVPSGIPRSGFVGLQIGHTRAHMARSILESAAFELRRALDIIRQPGFVVDRLWMVGGGARSPVWPGIVANATARIVHLPLYWDWPALGAALLAGAGAGLFLSLAEGQVRFRRPVREIEPDVAASAAMDRRYTAYQGLLKQHVRIGHLGR